MVVRGPEKRSTGQQRKRSIIPENDRSCAQFLIAQRGKCQATITRLNKFSFLGYFSSEEDAARAYDSAARDHLGGSAHRNFRDPVTVHSLPKLPLRPITIPLHFTSPREPGEHRSSQ